MRYKSCSISGLKTQKWVFRDSQIQKIWIVSIRVGTDDAFGVPDANKQAQANMKFFSYNLTLDIDGLQMVDPDRERPWVVDCLNPHSFVTAEEDAAFKQALTDCDILLPDGVGICMEVHHWKGRQIKKIAGDDFHRHVLGELEAMGGRIYYMGSNSSNI